VRVGEKSGSTRSIFCWSAVGSCGAFVLVPVNGCRRHHHRAPRSGPRSSSRAPMNAGEGFSAFVRGSPRQIGEGVIEEPR